MERLRALENYIVERIKKRARSDHSYFLNLYRLDPGTPYRPGVREIWLTRTRENVPNSYLDRVSDPSIWEETPAATEFRELMDFIRTFPFERLARILIIYDDAGNEVPAHRDHLDPNVCNEFVWCRTNLRKKFYVLDASTGVREYVGSYSCWFDVVNQYHGSDAGEGLNFSMRVDGVFTDDFRKRLPRPEINAASTPALWASID